MRLCYTVYYYFLTSNGFTLPIEQGMSKPLINYAHKPLFLNKSALVLSPHVEKIFDEQQKLI